MMRPLISKARQLSRRLRVLYEEGPRLDIWRVGPESPGVIQASPVATTRNNGKWRVFDGEAILRRCRCLRVYGIYRARRVSLPARASPLQCIRRTAEGMRRSPIFGESAVHCQIGAQR